MTSDSYQQRDPAVQEMLDKMAISEAIMRYFRGVDRADAELINSTYHPDAWDEHDGHEFNGLTVGPGIVETVLRSMTATRHNVGTQTIEVYGDEAAAETYCTGNHTLRDGRRIHTFVRYLDRLERRNGEWRIIHRSSVIDPFELLPPLQDTGHNPPQLARRDRTDPSYQLFRS
jgi:ketosteroid isomerase-like protein